MSDLGFKNILAASHAIDATQLTGRPLGSKKLKLKRSDSMKKDCLSNFKTASSIYSGAKVT